MNFDSFRVTIDTVGSVRVDIGRGQDRKKQSIRTIICDSGTNVQIV